MAKAEGSVSYVDVGGHRLRLTNLDKVLYPETGTTKAEVIDYYSRVSEAMIAAARDRPATRKRWVSGVGTDAKPGQVFFEKNLPDSAPDWILHRPIQHSGHVNEYPLVNNLATLVWIAQQAALEIHVPQWRFGRNGARKNPDRMVLDLDPGEGAGLAECAEVAKLVRELLQGMGLDPQAVTSGSKGIHLYAALDGKQSSDEISAVAHELARALEADHPDLVVSDMKKTNRTGKVLLDWSQNNGSKTTVVPYSLRGRSRPTVAAPRTWREIASPGLKQLEFGEVLKRLSAKGDLLADLSAGYLLGDSSGEDLAEYRRMRNRSKTPEPFGEVAGSDPSWRPDAASPHFVIQEHHASSLHYDFRLERDGVLVSWAVPKGVPTDPTQNHLAVHVEDHPFDYGTFEGRIPKGEYGAGEVAIWDRGRYELEKWRDGSDGHGEVIFTIHGEKHGSQRLALIQTKQGDNAKNWMLHFMKSQDPVDWDAEGGPVNKVTGDKWHGLASVSTGRKGLGTLKKTVVGSRLPSNSRHPMLATLGAMSGVDRFEGGADWAYEMKWDGIRAIATIDGDEVTFRSRNGLDLTGSYPELAELAQAVASSGRGDAVLDGEIVALDEKGRPNFGTLQKRMGLTTPRDVERARLATPVHFFVFDVLTLGGTSREKEPYAARRALLEKSVKDRGPITVPLDAGDDLATALTTSKQLGLEGVMAKRRDSPYREGKRSRDWIKLKHTLTQEVVVGGWRPGNGNRADSVGSLLVGIPDADGLRYVGRVGTGFTDRQLAELRTRLDGLARKTAPLLDVPSADARDAHWVTPSLVGEVEFAERTPDGRLRAPSWRGWRPDKDPSDVVRELPA